MVGSIMAVMWAAGWAGRLGGRVVRWHWQHREGLTEEIVGWIWTLILGTALVWAASRFWPALAPAPEPARVVRVERVVRLEVEIRSR